MSELSNVGMSAIRQGGKMHRMPYNQSNKQVDTYIPFKEKMPINAFKAQMDILGHSFILTVFGQVSEQIQTEWFDSIMEVLKIGSEKQG